MTETAPLVVLMPYPLSHGYREGLEASYGSNPVYLSLSELRRLPPLEMLRLLGSLRGCTCVLAFESAEAHPAQPLLEGLALGTLPARIEVCRHDLRRVPVSRRHIPAAAASLVTASARGLGAVRSARRELEQLVDEPRIEPAPAADRPDRLLYLNANLWLGLIAGGSVGHVAGVVNAFHGAGFEVNFATMSAPVGIAPGVRIHRLHPPSTFGVPFEGTYYRADREVRLRAAQIAAVSRPGLVYQRMSVASTSGVAVSRGRRIPLVLEYNGSEVWVAENWGRGLRYRHEAVLAEEASLRHAHVVVTVSEALRDELVERGVEPDRIVSHPNGVDTDRYDPARLAGERVETRRALGISPETVVVGFVGTFGPWHGAEVLARTIACAASERQPWLRASGVRFLFVGDGLRLPEVRAILDGSDAAALATFTGLVPQLDAPRYLAACDIVVSPHVPNADGSRFFGSPTKLFEYMSMGKAIVASRLGQLGEVLDPALSVDALPDGAPTSGDRSVAVLTHPADEAALGAALRFAVERPDWRERLGENARAAALDHYTWSHHVGAILDRLRWLGLRP
jgi:glycosyltransferase involved in cell wall biosynthesis